MILNLVQLQVKVVKVKDNALYLYQTDPLWHTETKELREVGIKTLEAIVGRVCPVKSAVWQNHRLYYQVPIAPAITIPDPLGNPVLFDNVYIPSDYVTVLQSGFMEAM